MCQFKKMTQNLFYPLCSTEITMANAEKLLDNKCEQRRKTSSFTRGTGMPTEVQRGPTSCCHNDLDHPPLDDPTQPTATDAPCNYTNHDK